ncbi:MAG TPA: cysteine desulfurase family protein [Candidatus Paceibacterota bacterium]
MKKQEKIFMDHASTTPVLLEVFSAMKPFLMNKFFNSQAIYERGVDVNKATENAREKIAKILNSHSDEIVFTGSGTESDNLALFGVIEDAWKKFKKPHMIVSSFEHPAILEAAKKIQKYGGEITYLGPDHDGIIQPALLKKFLKQNTVLVSIMYANNEIGVIQPIREIAKVIRDFKKNRLARKNFARQNFGGPYFHTDATAAANYLSLNTLELHVDLMTLDSSKIYGPKGVGALFRRRGTPIEPQIVGGGQEGGVRSGTENVAGIVAFAKALFIVQSDREKESKRLTKLRDYAISEIKRTYKHAKLNGSFGNRLPNNINFCFPGLDSEFAVIKLDTLGIECSSASTCKSMSETTNSYVIEAIGNGGCAESSLRFTFGRSTTKNEVKKMLLALKKVLKNI